MEHVPLTILMVTPCINAVQARGVDARLMEYVPPDILNATDGLDLDLDLNELMVRAQPCGAL